jgi:uroporphyrinogen decarboxylase
LVHKYLRELIGDTMMIGFHGDGTFSIPDGNEMYAFAYQLADDPAGVKAKAEAMCRSAIERNKALQASGVDCLLLCSDYCYNTGPFISPEMFAEFIQPYLARIIEEARKDGLYTIKHTDGNIMPILEQLVECRPHALHSIDPMAGVDIREVKRLVGDKVCLCGNVHCAALQTGTDEDVIRSAEYCLTYAKPGGGYIFCTSNIPFKGMPPERYRLILDVWKRMRMY